MNKEYTTLKFWKSYDWKSTTKENVTNIFSKMPDVSIRFGKNNETLLHRAIRHGANIDVIHYICHRGIDINSRDDYGVTPMHVAAMYRDRNTLFGLLRNFSDINVNARDTDGETPLHYLTSRPDTGCYLMALLLSHREIHTNAQNKNGDTPFHFVVGRDDANLSVINMFIEKGIKINTKNAQGKTPFYQAVYYNANIDVIRRLIDAGSKIHEPDNDGKMPIDLILKEHKLSRTQLYWKMHDARFA